MITRDQADTVAEAALAMYAEACEATTPDEVRKILELLLSKTARGIEKYCGAQQAQEVLTRTIVRLAEHPQASNAPLAN